MGQMIYFDHSKVTGYRKDERGNIHRVNDDFIHHRQQDPILMAAKRNNEMAACERFDVETWPAFNHWVDDVITTFTPSRAEAVPEYEW